jgi:hypothetical protein
MYDFDPRATLMAFSKLQETNKFRNDATSRNLSLAKEPGSKLSKLFDFTEALPSYRDRIMALCGPHNPFTLYWTLSGLLILVYYVFSIPFRLSFLHGTSAEDALIYLVIDFLLDLYWCVDIFLKAFFFSRADPLSSSVQLITDPSLLLSMYKQHGHFYADILSSLPLELLALLVLAITGSSSSAVMSVYILRLVHLGRVPQILSYFRRIEGQFFENHKFKFRASSVLFTQVLFLYVVVNHWLCCLYFILHRYAERHVAVTWATFDGLAEYDPATGMHNVCHSTIDCYIRAFYFTCCTMISVTNLHSKPQTPNL